MPCVPKRWRSDQNTFEVNFSRKIRFRQRWSFIRQLALLAQQPDRAGESLLAQRNGGFGAAMSRADNEGGVLLHWKPLLSLRGGTEVLYLILKGGNPSLIFWPCRNT